MRMRAFLAVNFSVAVTRRIAEEAAGRREALEQAGVRVAWVPAANLHLTVKFLGSVEEDLVPVAAERLRQALAGHVPFEAHAVGLGAFPQECQARVLWVGVRGGEGLERMQRDVEAAMTDLGFDPEARAYHPHVTVGRVQEAAADVSTLWKGEADLGASMMSELVVYESRTLRSGAEYVVRARVPIGRASDT